MIKSIVTFIVIAALLLVGYMIFIEKKSLDDVFQIGKETVEDKTLELKVKSQIEFNKNFENAEISVSAEDGEVTLTGTVGTSEKAMLAAQIADSVKGVKRVINKIKVSAELDDVSADGRSERERMLDEELESKAEAVLSTTEELDGAEIRVNVYKRVAFLEGKVLEERQKDIAVRLVKSLEKIRDVKEDLKTRFD